MVFWVYCTVPAFGLDPTGQGVGEHGNAPIALSMSVFAAHRFDRSFGCGQPQHRSPRFLGDGGIGLLWSLKRHAA